MTTKETFDIWAIIELFGHSKLAGRVSEQTIGGATFLRVDVPEMEGCPAFTRFYGAGAVYAITPTDEKTARRVVEALRPRPINVYGVIVPEYQLPVGEGNEEEPPF